MVGGISLIWAIPTNMLYPPRSGDADAAGTGRHPATGVCAVSSPCSRLSKAKRIPPCN